MRCLTPVLFAALALGAPTAAAAASDARTRPVVRPVDPPALARLEARERARVGVFAVHVRSGRSVAHRADERFPFASTFKVLAAGVTLRRASTKDLGEVVDIEASDIVVNSPVTDSFVGIGLPLRHLLAAALQWSDNAAGNLIVEHLGGLEPFQRELRRLGDRTTSIDRTEPDLNEARPGDARDTTTPRAIAADLRRLLLGDVLTNRRRQILRRLMLANATGDNTIRAAVPDTWKVADKTGTAAYGTRNDIAVAWPPAGGPVVIAVYTTHETADAKADDDLVAAATRTAIRALRR